MLPSLLLTCSVLCVASAEDAASTSADTPANALGRSVAQAAGDLYQLRRLTFTFIVESAGQEKLRRTHARDWDAGTVSVGLDGSCEVWSIL